MAYVRNYMGDYNMYLQQNDLMQSLLLIKSSVKGEREDEMFYDYLIKLAPTEEEREIIKSIRDDERKHNLMFRKIYKEFTGEEIKDVDKEEFIKPESYIEGIKKALFGELKAVEKYRKIRQGLPYTQYRDMLFEIITDEIKHAIKYNYILNLNSTPKKYKKKMREDFAARMEEVSNSFTEKSEYALEKVKEKLKDENILEEIIIPGIMMGIRSVYFADKNDDTSDLKVDIKQDILVKYVAILVAYILEKTKDKFDLEDLFEKFIIPQVLKS
ncbi:ferritin-like domain-containing protein [Clostridium sp. JNZ J1-5]